MSAAGVRARTSAAFAGDLPAWRGVCRHVAINPVFEKIDEGDTPLWSVPAWYAKRQCKLRQAEQRHHINLPVPNLPSMRAWRGRAPVTGEVT